MRVPYRELQKPSPRALMILLDADGIQAVIPHIVDPALDRVTHGFHLCGRVAITSRRRILVAHPVDVARDQAAGVIVRLRFLFLGDIVGDVDDIADASGGGEYTLESG